MIEDEGSLQVSVESMGPLSLEELRSLRLYWRAANFLSLGQIFLRQNPFFSRPMTAGDLKDEIFGDWGTIPGINLICAHLNRIVKRNNLKLLLVSGPGHGCAALAANSFLDGSYSEHYPEVESNAAGIDELFRRFSYRTYTHGAPGIPGTIQAGYELGHSLAHAYGAVLDNPDLIACCIVGDGEAETGALAAAWFSHMYLNRTRDGVVLPVVHLNRYKVAAPTVLSRLSNSQLEAMFQGYGYHPLIVEDTDPEAVQQHLAAALDTAVEDIRRLKSAGGNGSSATTPIWPMIVLKTPKGWTGPKVVDGKRFEGTSLDLRMKRFSPGDSTRQLKLLERWFFSYNIGSLFEKDGTLLAEPAQFIPDAEGRLGSQAAANGGRLRKDLNIPSLEESAVPVVSGAGEGEAAEVRIVSRVSDFLRDVIAANRKTFRLFSSDGTNSGEYLASIFDVTQRVLAGEGDAEEVDVGNEGRVVEMLSHRACQAWLEGYLLTGRHGVFVLSEHYTNIVASMLGHFAHWLACASEVPWRKPISSLNYLLISSQWCADSEVPVQEPGFTQAALIQPDKRIDVLLPPDCNTALATLANCLESTERINIIVIDADARQSLMTLDQARKHCLDGIGILEGEGSKPDVVLACAGAVPSRETLAAAALLRELVPDLVVQVVNVVNLNRLRDSGFHPGGLSRDRFERYFPPGAGLVFCHQGFVADIGILLAGRLRQQDFVLRGFRGNDRGAGGLAHAIASGIDRFGLALDALAVSGRSQASTEEACRAIEKRRESAL
ncbi:MAG: phosphoketolase family protein [Cyanobacteria bacterium HKST-UBA02]|nr:phosphoketolase family protein [Cyanobacteria bacterium HKST-UBA02]